MVENSNLLLRVRKALTDEVSADPTAAPVTLVDRVMKAQGDLIEEWTRERLSNIASRESRMWRLDTARAQRNGAQASFDFGLFPNLRIKMYFPKTRKEYSPLEANESVLFHERKRMLAAWRAKFKAASDAKYRTTIPPRVQRLDYAIGIIRTAPLPRDIKRQDLTFGRAQELHGEVAKATGQTPAEVWEAIRAKATKHAATGGA